jgi:hypothetical protein
MSKINKIQTTAVKSPADKVTPTNAPINKAVASTPVVAKNVVVKAATQKPAVALPVKKASPIKATPKVVAKPSLVKIKEDKTQKEKTPKLKMERDSFTMPKAEYAQFHVLKERLAKQGHHAKKSELLRAGIMQLSAMTDAALKAAMSKVPTIKTGRPKKK